MNEMNFQPAKEELIEAISYFITRQALVAQAMKEFGLDLNAIAILGAGGWTLGAEGAKEFFSVSTSNLSENFRNALQILIDNNIPRINQTGTWIDEKGDIWNYFMHGSGCRLINQFTNEPIDWDCPSTQYFDVYKFCFHLSWQIEANHQRFPHLANYLRIFDMNAIKNNLIPELVKDGKLIVDFPNQYRIA